MMYATCQFGTDRDTMDLVAAIHESQMAAGDRLVIMDESFDPITGFATMYVDYVDGNTVREFSALLCRLTGGGKQKDEAALTHIVWVTS